MVSMHFIALDALLATKQQPQKLSLNAFETRGSTAGDLSV
jgi:hypothetical protein